MPLFAKRPLQATLALAAAGALLVACGQRTEAPEPAEQPDASVLAILEQAGLETDASRSSIDLSLLLSGGPAKDGIPALTDPVMTPVEDVGTGVADSTRGILVEFQGERRFYPFSILVWHEIANDSIGDVHYAVTFCPLCGSGVVFDRVVAGHVLEFGVSGLLYESNLVMFDRATESLWSQSLGQAIAGEYTDTVLDILLMRVIEFGEVRDRYSDALVLSTETGHTRDYRRNPYSGYEDSEETWFPVTVDDSRYFAKELFWVVPLEGGASVAIRQDALSEDPAEREIEGATLRAYRDGGATVVEIDGEPVPGYVEMWFSWATQHSEDGIVWDPSD